jgi:hypothetical protein
VNRRHFLSVLGVGTAGFVLDPERLLWRVGQKTIFLPPAGGWMRRDKITLLHATGAHQWRYLTAEESAKQVVTLDIGWLPVGPCAVVIDLAGERITYAAGLSPVANRIFAPQFV